MKTMLVIVLSCFLASSAFAVIGPSSKPSLPDGLPVVQNAEGSILMSVGTSTGGPDIPVATLNTDCVVTIQSVSWGDVKALYR